jgi:hypothetical protein
VFIRAELNLGIAWDAQEHGKIAVGRKFDVDAMNA